MHESIEEKILLVCQDIHRMIAELGLSGPTLPHALTKKAAAKELSISISTLNRLISAGRLTTTDPSNGRAMIPASEIQRLAAPAPARGANKAKPRKRPMTIQEEIKAGREALKKI